MISRFSAALSGQTSPQATLADQIRVACLLECTARKPGNVHPGASFANTTFADFERSAKVVSPILAQAATLGVGRSIEKAVQATRQAVGTNTNLGMILLLAPLAAIPPGQRCADGIDDVLTALTAEDTRCVYSAIRCAQPGGLGEVPDQDVGGEPTVSLREAMSLAADRDLIARQYQNGFEEVLTFARGVFLQSVQSDQDWETAIITTQLRLMAAHPDSLIARKCGTQLAAESQVRAAQVLASGWPDESAGNALQEFDAWLRGDGHRRNPGTTADLIAATLFAVIRDDWLLVGSREWVARN